VSREEQYASVFLLDTYCLGVKNAFFKTVDRQDADGLLRALGSSETVVPAEPGEARKLLHDAVAWAGGNGFPPHEDYAHAEALFGAIMPAETDYTPRLGYEGKVCYIPSPVETPAEVMQRMKRVRERFGEEESVDLTFLARSVLQARGYHLDHELAREAD
jgi:hypothetical protein